MAVADSSHGSEPTTATVEASALDTTTVLKLLGYE
jgi:hypothetical protein